MVASENDYLFTEKKVKLIFTVFSQWKNVVLFLSDMNFCFFKQLASAIEEGKKSLFVPGIHVIGDQIKSSTIPYLGKQTFPGQNSNLPRAQDRIWGNRKIRLCTAATKSDRIKTIRPAPRQD
jgi:hypothetical protein